MIYHRKESLLKAIEQSDTEPALIINFLDSNGVYKFTYFNTHNEFIEDLCNYYADKDNYYINEMILDNTLRKPYLDIEHVFLEKKEYEENRVNVLKKIQKDIIAVFLAEYDEVITKKDILLLESSGAINGGFKMSFHVIISPSNRTLCYTNSNLSKSSSCHLYASLVRMDSIYMSLLDSHVYNTDATLRIIGSSKSFDDNRVFKPLDCNTFEVIEVINIKPYMLSYISIKKPVKVLSTLLIKQTTVSEKTIHNKMIPQTNVCEKLLKCVQKYHPTAFYNGTYKNIYHGFNYINRAEKCPISKSIHSGSNGFYVFETDRGYYLKCHSANCEGSIHIGYIDHSCDFLDHAIQIDQPYLTNQPNKQVEEIITKWLTSTTKTLAIKSAMGTGKTTMIHQILEDYDLKKILWITHRQTLTKQIYGSFGKLNFKNYMDEEGCLLDNDRLIVQIDSLMRIINRDTSCAIFKRYDLIIIDEIEGSINHFNSPFLGRGPHTSRDIFNFMVKCINHAKKLLVLDADIGIRTNLFINEFGQSIIVNNNYFPIKKKFTITNSSTDFTSALLDDINNNKNVCVVSMSASALENIEVSLKQLGVKYVMHTSRTDDKLKNELEDVNKFWINFKVVLYSPTIESGVDFNEEHFNKIYCILKNGQMTCSQRGFLQMVGRIRKISDHNILCFYDGDISTNSLIYTFNDVLGYCKYYEEINGKKMLDNIQYEEIINNDSIQLVRIDNKISLFDAINIYNEVEQLNKHPKIFMTILSSLIQRKGHQLAFNIVETKNTKVKNDLKTKIAQVDETKYDISILLKKQSKNNLSAEEKIVLLKYFFMKKFGVNDSSNKEEMSQFIDQYYGKDSLISHFEIFFGYKNKVDTDFDTLNDAKEKVRKKIIVDFLNRLLNLKKTNYILTDLDKITIPNGQYVKSIKDIIKNSLYFTNEIKHRSLFFKSKNNYISDKTNKKYYISTIQSLLKTYGIILSQGTRKREDGNRICDYSLSVSPQIKDIVDFKYRRINYVPSFPHIFNYNLLL